MQKYVCAVTRAGLPRRRPGGAGCSPVQAVGPAKGALSFLPTALYSGTHQPGPAPACPLVAALWQGMPAIS